MFTICYVLTDNSKLFYYNQLMISIYSLRKYSPLQKICVLIDEVTKSILKVQNRTELYYDENIEVLTIDIADNYNQKEKSRYLKLKTRELLSGTFLYVDTDTIFSDKLPEMPTNSELALVLDLNIKFEQRIDIEEIKNMSSSYGYPIEDHKYEYYNSGVIWTKDTELCHYFFDEWFKHWDKNRIKGQVLDQPSLNYVNRKNKGVISTLEPAFNVQVSATPAPIQYLSSAVIIHYFNVIENGSYLLNDKNIINLSAYSEKIKDIISNPKSAFAPCILIKKNSEIDSILSSRVFRAIKGIYIKYPEWFKFIDKLLSYRRGW